MGSSPTIFHLFGRYRLVGKAEDYFKCLEYAAVAKLANAGVSKASDGNIVQVQVLSAAPKNNSMRLMCATAIKIGKHPV